MVGQKVLCALKQIATTGRFFFERVTTKPFEKCSLRIKCVFDLSRSSNFNKRA